MLRFQEACRLARTQASGGWAGIAAESGYADQAHLAREFSDLAGESPTAWARRVALIDARLARPLDT
jgi:AraC-like DNA-binding protein